VKLKFYTTLGCHLCEQALELVRILQADNSVLVGQDIEVCEIDIADSEELMAEYGIRIPVIQLESVDADIGWPFTLDQLAEYLNS
jgi:hypothetical protein